MKDRDRGGAGEQGRGDQRPKPHRNKNILLKHFLKCKCLEKVNKRASVIQGQISQRIQGRN